jgi:competence protein ComEA
MFKKVLAFFAAMSLVAAFAAVDVNKASEAELDGIKGIGPVTSKLIISERKKSEFKNWDDFISRVKGVGEKSAAKFSAEGLTVGGAGFKAAATAKKDDKPAAKAEEKKADAKVAAAAAAPASSAKEMKKEAKAEAKVEAKAKVEAAKPAASAAKK